MPVTQPDIDDFCESWQKFDPNGHGNIACHELELFIHDIATNRPNCKLIANKKRIKKNVSYRRKYIASLEIPSHEKFGHFLFMDTLQCMSR